MKASTGRTDRVREVVLDGGLRIFQFQRHTPFATGVRGTDLAQRGHDGGEIGVVEQSLLVQHLGVRDAGFDVVGNQPVVEFMILTRGVGEHPRIQRCALVPQSAHGGDLIG